MADLDSKVLKDITQQIEKQPIIMQSIIQQKLKEEQNKFNKALKESKIQDRKLKLMIEESTNSDGTYKASIDKLLKSYIKESKLSAKEDIKVQELLKESARVQSLNRDELKQQRKRDAKDNPLLAFKQSFEDITQKKGTKEAGSTLMSGLKEGFNLKNITKGILHGAGIALDNPALNILASEIQSSVKEQEDINTKQSDFLKRLNDINEDDKTTSEEQYNAFVDTNKDLLNEINQDTQNGFSSNNIGDILKKLENVESNTESTYTDLGSELENISQELKGQTKIFKEQMFLQKDMMDDLKNKGSSGGPIGPRLANEDEIPEDDFGLLDDLSVGPLGMGGGKSKGKSKGSKKLKGMTKAVASFGKGILRVAGPIGLAVGALTSVYEGVQGYKDTEKNFDLKAGESATLSQKASSVLGSVASGLTFGLLDEVQMAKGLESIKMPDFLREMGSSESSVDLVDKLESEGVVDTSFLGKSKIRDWDKIRALTKEQIEAVYKYNDWDLDTRNQLLDLMNTSKENINNKVRADVQESNELKNIKNTDSSKQEIPKPKENGYVQHIAPVSSSPLVLNQDSSKPESKLKSYSIEPDDLYTQMKLRGIL